MYSFSIAILISIYSINSFAGNNDSVLNPNLAIPNQIQSSGGTSNGSPIVSVSTSEFQYGTCPAGFSYNGSNQFPLQVRTITTNYSNGKLVKYNKFLYSIIRLLKKDSKNCLFSDDNKYELIKLIISLINYNYIYY